MDAKNFKISLFLGFTFLGISASNAHADCPLISVCADGEVMDIHYNTPDLANYAASNYQGCRITRVSPTELQMCNPRKSDKAVRAAAAKSAEVDSLKEVQHTLLNIGLTGAKGAGGCKSDDLGDYDRDCVNYAKKLVVTRLQDAVKAHPELQSAIDALSQPCPGEHLSAGVGPICMNKEVDKALAAVGPVEGKLQDALKAQATPVTVPNSTAVTSTRSSSGSTLRGTGAVPLPRAVNGGEGSPPNAVVGQGVNVPGAPAVVQNDVTNKTADAINGGLSTTSRDGAKADVQANNASVSNVDYSTCTFVRFARAENISAYGGKNGNKLQHDESASSAFNEFDVSCGEDSPKPKAVCFGTVECKASVQIDGKTSIKLPVEMAVACSNSDGDCENIVASACADPKKDGKQITAKNAADIKIRRVGNTDVTSEKSKSGTAVSP